MYLLQIYKCHILKCLLIYHSSIVSLENSNKFFIFLGTHRQWVVVVVASTGTRRRRRYIQAYLSRQWTDDLFFFVIYSVSLLVITCDGGKSSYTRVKIKETYNSWWRVWELKIYSHLEESTSRQNNRQHCRRFFFHCLSNSNRSYRLFEGYIFLFPHIEWKVYLYIYFFLKFSFRDISQRPHHLMVVSNCGILMNFFHHHHHHHRFLIYWKNKKIKNINVFSQDKILPLKWHVDFYLDCNCGMSGRCANKIRTFSIQRFDCKSSDWFLSYSKTLSAICPFVNPLSLIYI